MQALQPGVRAALVAQAPLDQLLELPGLGGAQRVRCLRLAQPLGLVLLPQALLLVGLALAEDVVVVVVASRPRPRPRVAGSGSCVIAERERAGQEPLLQQHRHDVAARLGAVLLGAARDDLVEQRRTSPVRSSSGVNGRRLT